MSIKNFIISFLVVILFEIIQFGLHVGLFDVDTIILGSLGSLIGYFILKMILFKNQSIISNKFI